jgi:hypothetical protein
MKQVFPRFLKPDKGRAPAIVPVYGLEILKGVKVLSACSLEKPSELVFSLLSSLDMF